MKLLSLVLLAATAGCGAEVSGGVQRQSPDASSQPDPEPDPDPDPDPDPIPPDAPPVARCDNGRKLYLNFEGVQLRSTQVRSDATINAAAWAGGTYNLPAYHANSATRANDIAAVTSQITAALSAFPVTVVTTRPVAGPYVMIVFGGSSVTHMGTQEEYAAYSSVDCGDAWPSDVAWVSDVAPTSAFAGNVALGALGLSLGLSGTTDPTDCMCGFGTTCQISTTTGCTLQVEQTQDFCANNATITQDAPAAVRAGFCEPLVP